MRWQVIDTPGILDHPLEERNTIEMQAITALAHLQATVLYFVDISETCGYSIKQQVALYHSIKPLFANKPLLIVANKIDLKQLDQLDPEDRGLIDSIAADKNSQLIPMSNATEEGINTVKTTACDLLLSHRVEKKYKSRKAADVVNRIHVAYPVKRDDKVREISIPESVMAARAAQTPKAKRRTLRDVEAEQGGAGVFNFDYRHHRQLDNEEWKFDIIPEIIDGKNIADFVDPDIEARLAELELEEEELERQAELAGDAMDSESELDSETEELYYRIKEKKEEIVSANILRSSNNKPILPRRGRTRSISEAAAQLDELGVKTDKFRDSSRTRSKSKAEVKVAVQLAGKKRRDSLAGKDVDVAMSAADSSEGGAMEEDMSKGAKKKLRAESRSASRRPSHSQVRGRSVSVPRDQSGLRDKSSIQKTVQLRKISQSRSRSRDKHQTGEADRVFGTQRPKHLYSGKKGKGTADWR
jgi:nucleolar GTP-binding protein